MSVKGPNSIIIPTNESAVAFSDLNSSFNVIKKGEDGHQGVSGRGPEMAGKDKIEVGVVDLHSVVDIIATPEEGRNSNIQSHPQSQLDYIIKDA